MKKLHNIAVRRYVTADFSALFRINQQGVPGVGNESKTSLQTWINLSTVFVATDANDQPLGFMTLIEPGTLAYGSANLRWFEAYTARTGIDLIYVDRIAVEQTARGAGVGAALYEAAFEAFAFRQQIGCEVNTNPPNPGSHRFHTGLGFRAVGMRQYGPEPKAVTYYVRDLG